MIGRPGEGFILAQKRLGGGRIHHAMRMIGQAKRAFDMLCERASRGSPTGRCCRGIRSVQDFVAESAIDIETARLLTLKAAWTMDTTGASNSRKEIAMVKYYVAGVAYNVIDRAIQVHGALGYTTDLPLESMYRSVRAMRIADGADEVHKVTIANSVLRDYDAVEGWPSEHLPTQREAAIARFGHRRPAHREPLTR